MPYATLQDLVDRFGERELVDLTDRAGGGTIDVTVVQRALDDGAEMIEGYLAKRYTLPLSAPVARLTAVACDIARYQLYTVAPSEVVTARYRDAERWLRDVADGRVVLEAAGLAPASGSAGGDDVRFTAPSKVFDGPMGGF